MREQMLVFAVGFGNNIETLIDNGISFNSLFFLLVKQQTWILLLSDQVVAGTLRPVLHHNGIESVEFIFSPGSYIWSVTLIAKNVEIPGQQK